MNIDDYFYAWKPALFRKKTRGWTIVQRGIYRELIDEYMLTREPLPSDDLSLADIARVPLDVWLENKHVILAKFELENEKLFHEHCNEELDDQDRISKRRSKASKKAAATRWKEKKNPKMRLRCDDDAKAMRFNATGQDRTGQYISTPVSPSLSTPDPVEEKPTPKKKPAADAKAPASKGSRLPKDWQPSDEFINFALKEGMPMDRVQRQADTFRDFWTSKAGAGATKTDWLATWRNWIRKDLEKYPTRSAGSTSRMPNGQPDYMANLVARAQNASRNISGGDQ